MIFLPYFSTTVKMYVEILFSMLVRCCHGHDYPGPDGIFSVYCLSHVFPLAISKTYSASESQMQP